MILCLNERDSLLPLNTEKTKNFFTQVVNEYNTFNKIKRSRLDAPVKGCGPSCLTKININLH